MRLSAQVLIEEVTMAAAQRLPQPAVRLSAAERRVQLAHVAARLFQELGYHQVSLGDVAAAAGITGPAVYRHFRNKEALLAAAITSGLDLVEEAVALTAQGSLDGMVAAVAEVGLHRSDMWVLLQRESRFLRPELRAPIQDQFSGVVDGFSRRLRRDRPELAPDRARLLVTAATAVLSLPATTHTSLDPAEYRRELIHSALGCLRADLGQARPDLPAGYVVCREPPLSRRDQVVDTAIGLFFRSGYGGASLDEIGAAMGIAGPSILHHFVTKSDILVAAFDRASARLSEARGQRRSSARTPELTALVNAYIAFALANRVLLGVYVCEQMYLPDDALGRTRATIRAELNEWTNALGAASPDLDEHVARVRVRAALTAINDLVRVGHFAQRPQIGPEIANIAAAILRAGR